MQNPEYRIKSIVIVNHDSTAADLILKILTKWEEIMKTKTKRAQLESFHYEEGLEAMKLIIKVAENPSYIQRAKTLRYRISQNWRP